MLATCLVNGWPADATYLDTDHPLQRHLTAVIARLAGEPLAGIGVDGCGAPAHRIRRCSGSPGPCEPWRPARPGAPRQRSPAR